jgi:hypothetical protein
MLHLNNKGELKGNHLHEMFSKETKLEVGVSKIYGRIAYI